MNEISVIIFGDICPQWNKTQQFNTGDYNSVFNDISNVIFDADYVVANLESPATCSENKLEKNSCNLKCGSQDIRILADAGFDAVALANNHILDYGIEGLEDTFKYLEKYSMDCYGAGSVQKASRALFTDINGKRVGFIAFAEHEFNCAMDYGKGANMWDDIDGLKAICEAKSECDYLVVQYHGGIEHYIYPSPMLQKRCRAMAEAGADFITCQHSHCIGTHENWQGSEILYGQGNSLFGYEEGKEQWNQGLIAKVEIGDNLTVSYIPIEAKTDGECLMTDLAAEKLLQTFEVESDKISDSEFIRVEWNKFCKSQKDMYLPMMFARGRIFNKLNRMTNGLLIEKLTKASARMTSMNLIRCDAHREVVETILENEFYGK